MTRAQATHVPAAPPQPMKAGSAVVTVDLDEFWCSDCVTRSLFERFAADGDGSEWACTTCGAAYLDAIDLVVEVSDSLAARNSA